MSLKGNLRDFGVADVFQLIGNQKKTGALVLKGGRGGRTVRVFFRAGEILKVDVSHRDKRALLGQRLLRTGLIDQEQLKVGLKAHRKSVERLGDVLVGQGAVHEHTVQKVVDLQGREVLYDLFEWVDGEYRFEPASEPGLEVMTPIPAEAILMDGFRLLDEWPLVRARINNYSVVYRVSRSLRSSDTSALSETARAIADLIDSKRNVHELIDVGGVGEFETCKSLSLLLSHGFIAPVKVRAPEQVHSRMRRKPVGQRVMYWLVNAIAVCSLIGLCFLSVESLALPSLTASVDEIVERLSARHGERHLVLARRALEVYRVEFGRYPDALSELTRTKGLLPNMIRDLELSGVKYVSVGGDYELVFGRN